MAGTKFIVIFRAEARDEAVEAAGYIADQGYPERAIKWYDGLVAAINSLADSPRGCPHAREQAAFPEIELRQLVFKSHRLIFTIRGKEVHVLHVRHVAQENLDSI